MKRSEIPRNPTKIAAWVQSSRRALPKVSASQKIRNREYSKAAAQLRKESPYCARCALKGLEVIATSTHHIGGRVGQRMSDKKLLIRLCFSCHHFCENNWNEAVNEGFMISKHIGANE